MNALRALGDLMAPRVCVVCGRQLGMKEQHLCIWCASDLPLTRYWTRPHNPMADRFNEVVERYRRPEDPELYAYAVALIFYRGGNPYRRIPQALKYHYNLSAGRYFARMLGDKMAGAAHFADVDLILPVPLHWTRRWSRGYNQAEVLARALGARLGIPVRCDVLRRKRRTRTQTHLSMEEKAHNVSGAFCVRPAALKNLQPRHILLLDDTFTTGATLYGCFAVLRAALGPGVRISVCTLAAVTDV